MPYSKECELQTKYQKYLVKHRQKTRTHNEGAGYLHKDSDKNKTYSCEWKTERKFPEIKESLSKKDAAKFLQRIVSRFLGREVANDLKHNFKDAGLKISKIREPLCYDAWKEKYLRLEGRFK